MTNRCLYQVYGSSSVNASQMLQELKSTFNSTSRATIMELRSQFQQVGMIISAFKIILSVSKQLPII